MRPFQVKWAVPYCIWIAKSARIAKTIGHCRSIKSRSNDCRSNKCRSNDCRSIECRSNDIIPYYGKGWKTGVLLLATKDLTLTRWERLQVVTYLLRAENVVFSIYTIEWRSEWVRKDTKFKGLSEAVNRRTGCCLIPTVEFVCYIMAGSAGIRWRDALGPSQFPPSWRWKSA